MVRVWKLLSNHDENLKAHQVSLHHEVVTDLKSGRGMPLMIPNQMCCSANLKGKQKDMNMKCAPLKPALKVALGLSGKLGKRMLRVAHFNETPLVGGVCGVRVIVNGFNQPKIRTRSTLSVARKPPSPATSPCVCMTACADLWGVYVGECETNAR